VHDAHRHLPDGAGIPAGVIAAVVNGTSPADWPAVAALAREDRRVTPAFGLHPWWVGSVGEGWGAELARLLAAFPAAAVGEVGLDRSERRRATFPTQIDVLAGQLAIARAAGRTVVVHCVRAWPQLEAALAGAPPGPVLLHAFAGPVDRIDALLALGATFSFVHGLAERPQARVAAARVPLDRLLLESDAPRPGPGLADAYAALAAIRGIDREEVAAACAATYERLFGASASSSA
jgi:TatD DNase family protein